MDVPSTRHAHFEAEQRHRQGRQDRQGKQVRQGGQDGQSRQGRQGRQTGQTGQAGRASDARTLFATFLFVPWMFWTPERPVAMIHCAWTPKRDL